MMRTMTQRACILLAAVMMIPLAWVAVVSAQRAQPTPPAPTQDQSILGPGLYVFQTRIVDATCGDADRTGDVTSYYAAVDGIPGSRSMRMGLLNSTFWPQWALTVSPADHVLGEAQQAGVTGPHRGNAAFDVALDNGRFVGRGSREYTRTVNGQAMRCSVHFDALLKRIDR